MLSESLGAISGDLRLAATVGFSFSREQRGTSGVRAISRRNASWVFLHDKAVSLPQKGEQNPSDSSRKHLCVVMNLLALSILTAARAPSLMLGLVQTRQRNLDLSAEVNQPSAILTGSPVLSVEQETTQPTMEG